MTARLSNAEAKVGEHEAERCLKRAKKESFTVKELLLDLGLNVPKNRMNRFGTDIKKKFDEQYPGNTTFLKHGTTSFRSEDRAILENLVVKEHRELELKLQGAVSANAGVEVEEWCAGSADDTSPRN